MRNWVTLCLTILALATTAAAITMPPLTTSLLGSNDQLELRLGYRPQAGRSEIGLDGIWLDGLEGVAEGYGLAAYATYDVVSGLDLPWTMPFGMGNGTLKADGYLGARIGMVSPRDGDFDPDATAALLAGIRFGGPKVQVGVEFQQNLTKDLWSSLADLPESRVVACVGYHF